MTLTRRRFLTQSAILGCSAAASPLMTPVSFAAAPKGAGFKDHRLVVIILRGAMDGLGVVQPYGDPSFAGLRKTTGFDADSSLDLDGFYALHSGLSALYPLWQAGELGVAHAVSTPYRDKRSHFDGQDLLEAGTVGLQNLRDGWLNRLLQNMPNVTGETAYAIGRSEMLLLNGPAEFSSWSPEASLALSDASLQLVKLVAQEDPLFAKAVDQAIRLSGAAELAANSGDIEDMFDAMEASGRQAMARDAHISVAEFAAQKLREEARIAAFSIGGWDTHANQSRSIKGPLSQLSDTILTLRDTLGADWDKTAVIAMTEFGRTAAENGTGGTDHGTAGAAILAGGALNGGKEIADWPGLASSDLYAGRDLMPVRDVRAIAGWIMHDLIGLDRGLIEGSVFPGLDMGRSPKLIL